MLDRNISTYFLYSYFRMGDQGESRQDSNTSPQSRLDILKKHIIDNKVDVGLWTTRLLTMLFTFFYFIPIFG